MNDWSVLIMNKVFLAALLVSIVQAGSKIYDKNYIPDGTFCVDQNARDLFTALNDLRVKGTQSEFYPAFKTACEEVATNGSWTTERKNKITV